MAAPEAAGREVPPFLPPPYSLVVDARALNSSGIGRYLRGVLRAILEDDRFSRVTLLGRRSELGAFVGPLSGASEVRIEEYRGNTYSLTSQLDWLRLRSRGIASADAHFFPHFDAPYFLPLRSVVTVHDLIHFRVPEAFSKRLLPLAAALMDRVVTRAERVITVSKTTATDLTERLPSAAHKIVAILNGIDPFFRPLHPAEGAERADLRELGRFVLCVGNRKAHKNLKTAVEALAILRRDWPDVRLVVAGGAANYNDWAVVRTYARGLGVKSAIFDAREVTDSDLRFLYSRSVALLVPSMYEGFGLPAVEAMASGAPVVASNRGSLPEVVGDAGVLLDPTDAAGMAAALLRMGQDGEWRQDLVQKGITRAKRFDLSHSVARTVDEIVEVASRAEPRGVRAQSESTRSVEVSRA